MKPVSGCAIAAVADEHELDALVSLELGGGAEKKIEHLCKLAYRAQQLQDRLVTDPFLHRLHELSVRNLRKAGSNVRLRHPPAAPRALIDEHLQGIVLRPPRAEPEAGWQEIRLEDRLKHDLHSGLHDPVANRRDG